MGCAVEHSFCFDIKIGPHFQSTVFRLRASLSFSESGMIPFLVSFNDSCAKPLYFGTCCLHRKLTRVFTTVGAYGCNTAPLKIWQVRNALPAFYLLRLLLNAADCLIIPGLLNLTLIV